MLLLPEHVNTNVFMSYYNNLWCQIDYTRWRGHVN